MKLSEAIREGMKLIPQCTGRFFDVSDEIDANGQHRVIAACVLGTAYIGLHPEAIEAAPSNREVSDEITRHWGDLGDILNLAALHNDRGNHRLAIVKWLEGIGA